MRTLVLAAVLAAAPAGARADDLLGGGPPPSPLVALGQAHPPGPAFRSLRLDLEPFGSVQRTPASFDLPRLRLDGETPVLLDEGGGAGSHRRSGVDPVVALVLGIIPGFGLGHVISGSPRFPLWLVADVAILVFWYFGVWAEPYYLDSDPLRGLFLLLILAERIVEGVDAFHQAGGRFSELGRPPDDVRLALNTARPERDPAGPGAWVFARAR